MFCADSRYALGLAGQMMGLDDGWARWRLGYVSVASMVESCGLSGTEKLELCSRGLGKPDRRDAFGVLFRRHSVELMGLVRSSVVQRMDGQYAEALTMRNACIAEYARELRALEAGGRLARPLVDIVGSLIHMTLNRLACRPTTRAERLVYYSLGRSYAAQAKAET